MSNKIFSTFLLALFLLAIAACNDPTPIGDDFVDDADLLNATFTDTLTVEVTLQKRTELGATTGAETLIGSLHDPVFGFCKSKFILSAIHNSLSYFG